MNKVIMPQFAALAGLLENDHIVLKMRVASKAALLADLAHRAAIYTGLAEASLRGSLTAREALGSTGFGAGIAMPHARIIGLTDPFALFVQLSRPIPFDAIDGLPVDLVFMLLSPAASEGTHLAVLAAISRRLRDKDVADRLRKAKSPVEVLRVVVEI